MIQRDLGPDQTPKGPALQRAEKCALTLKLLHWDGQGFCIYYKVLERGRFPWPTTQDGAVRLTSAQFSMLWEGIDWRRPDWGAPPARAG